MESQGCATCEELLAVYREAIIELGRVSRQAAQVSLSLERDLYEQAWNNAKAANSECTSLRKLILSHLESHQEPKWVTEAWLRLPY
jgi:hypothetical protein